MRRFILAAILFPLAGCVTVHSTLLPGAERAGVPLEPRLVDILISPPDTLPSDCQRIALLTAEGDASFTNRQEMIDKMREEAGRLGANTLFLSSIDEPGGLETAPNRNSEALALFCEVGGPNPRAAEPPTPDVQPVRWG